MRKNLDLVSLIGGLHEGVVDDAAWSRAISDICDIVDVPKLLMGRIARGGRSLDLTFAHRANLIQAAMLSGPLADPAHNPWLRLAETHPLRTPATVAHLGGRSALEEAAIWPNFYVLFQLGDSMGAALERQPEYTDIVVVARPAGATEFDTANVAALAEILPHLARSWRVRHALIDMQRTVGTLTHILDRFERAVVVAGPSGEVRFANAAADRLLTRGGAIDAKSGRLRATRHDQTKALHALIEAATRTATGRGDVAVDAMALSIEDQPAALSVVAEPLAPAHARAVGHLGDAGALLFIGDSEAATKPPLERLRIVYGMTEAEARITSMIAAGHSIASLAPGARGFAEHRKVSPEEYLREGWGHAPGGPAASNTRRCRRTGRARLSWKHRLEGTPCDAEETSMKFVARPDAAHLRRAAKIALQNAHPRLRSNQWATAPRLAKPPASQRSRQPDDRERAGHRRFRPRERSHGAGNR